MMVVGIVVLALVTWGLGYIPLEWDDLWASVVAYALLIVGFLAASAVFAELTI